ncbi:MAG TPA: flagellar basal body L-ring protein FlgH [Candidatus Kapabacteria bacterium]|nr:flagellar basal body L-ring protein FlgH [Candidatus Kapabacteria bacterium]HOQ49497.1 flagellar basal body L-ring protein FlgH [Candidatus Kapabacteria bacterium]HPP40250.1 flagellar basal body L-ring protein FlgH [Candidatus Kapabacteria bacterium]HPU24011.1 flagellar basal body L-ring protein FlgH [Candidatus Kapabacteria bacterium]
MKKLFLILLCLLYSQFIFAQFKPQEQSLRSLFSDVKAFQVDDAIMVYIVEDTQADNNASTEERKSTELGGGVGFSTGTSNTNVSGNIGTNNNFRGSGRTTRNEKIRSRLSARVVEVQPNGNLLIEGKRTTKVNGETQTITIRGIVRPVDVNSDNSVYSYNIMDLTLLIEGDGTVSKTQEPGLITRFLRILF